MFSLVYHGLGLYLLFNQSTLFILCPVLKLVLLCQPGDCKSVILVSIGGKKVIRGGNGIVDGPVDPANYAAVAEAINRRGFGNQEEANARLRISDRALSCCIFNFYLVLFQPK